MKSFLQHAAERANLAEALITEGHHIPSGHVQISKDEHEKLKAALGSFRRSPKGTEVHGHTRFVYTHAPYTSTQHYAHPDHGVPSTWEHYNTDTRETHYSKKADK